MRKILIITLSLTFIMLLLVPYKTFAWLSLNENSSVYYPEGHGTDGKIQDTTFNEQNVSKLIVEGSGYFANSQSDYLNFLNKIEMSELNGVDYQGLQESLLLSFENLEKAIITYENIVSTADNTPYNPNIIKKLKSFDYVTFQNKKCLNSVIFGWVSDYLKKGDVRKIYKAIHEKMESLSIQLITIKSMIDKEQFPKIANVWQINQMYNELMLSNQYLAHVFYEIKK